MNQFEIGKPFSEELNKLSKAEIRDNLESVCYDVVEKDYTRNLGHEELSVKKSELAEVSIKIAAIEDKKREVLSEIKAELQEPKTEKSKLLEAIKHKSERTEGILYLIDDQEANLMYSFDEKGICVDVRPMLPSEKQAKLKSIKTMNHG